MRKFFTLLSSIICLLILFSCNSSCYFVVKFDCNDISQVSPFKDLCSLSADNPQQVVLQYRHMGDILWKDYKLKFDDETNIATVNLLEISKNDKGIIAPFELRVKGINYIYMAKSSRPYNCPVTLKSWGKNNKWKSMSFMFSLFKNLKITATDIPDLSNCTSMEEMFNCSNIDNIPNIEKWDTSNVTDMSSMFYGATNFNKNIGNWNTSKVTDMSRMFFHAKAFNQDISNWNTSNVVNMVGMFIGAKSFNQNIGNWDTSNVTDMSFMFWDAKSFNKNISMWNVNSVSDFYRIFDNCPIKEDYKPQKFRSLK